ncbi:conjugal transfer pilus assembly protein TraU [Klebsiella pneumoniae]|uniref:Conjugal transfer pilus assembly protein TraU n=1 Tax=Klebsiella pneumoniae TaxID=573 RepID=A0A2X1QIS5_KLEPN|nr:conjugal transfer pilus assembly protein TraU [Klebsiella pneumoniae]
MDIAYLSEIDPTWVDSSLTTILNPEAVIFANPIAQGPVQQMPLPAPLICLSMFCSGCAGSQGSMYPFNGWVSMSPVRCSPPCWSVNAWRSNYTVRA